ncbi:hypothetical protein DW982_07770 [Phocaeicola plebeius]|nr:hypothetical protein DW982_07770 [Phocaeicola plebeius]
MDRRDFLKMSSVAAFSAVCAWTGVSRFSPSHRIVRVSLYVEIWNIAIWADWMYRLSGWDAFPW